MQLITEITFPRHSNLLRCTCVCIYIYIYTGLKGNCLLCSVGNISVLNHEDDPVDFTKAMFKLNLSQFTMQKVKVKTEWQSNDGAFGIWRRLFSKRQREISHVLITVTVLIESFNISLVAVHCGGKKGEETYFMLGYFWKSVLEIS